MITKEDFLKKYNITEDSFKAAEISWDEICIIYNDFDENEGHNYIKEEKRWIPTKCRWNLQVKLPETV